MSLIHINFHPDAVFHALTHFSVLDETVREELTGNGFTEEEIVRQLNASGSKFAETFARSPQQAVLRLLRAFPERFREPQPDPDGRLRLSFAFDSPIGHANVIETAELTAAELGTLRQEKRNGLIVRSVKTGRKIPACECQLILASGGNGYEFCSAFPGEAAPPLPPEGGTSPYWDTHLFIR